MTDINDVCDYVIVKITEDGRALNVLKLHKLLYYIQAWHLAFNRGPLFRGAFQAWVHGPVSRQIYDRYATTKSMYSRLTLDDIRSEFNPFSTLEPEVRAHVDAVLEEYGDLSGDQLEEMTHQEEPWIQARIGVPPAARSENLISEDLMADYYRSRL